MDSVKIFILEFLVVWAEKVGTHIIDSSLQVDCDMQWPWTPYFVSQEALQDAAHRLLIDYFSFIFWYLFNSALVCPMRFGDQFQFKFYVKTISVFFIPNTNKNVMVCAILFVIKSYIVPMMIATNDLKR